MALDGAFLRHTAKEIEQAALGARVDKIYQPNREEIIVSLRSREGAVRLLLSARANSARIHITEHVPENPKQPPMLCMLLRKKLGGAKLTGVHQTELERAIALQFEAYNELGDLVPCTLVTEIMGRHSNVILVDREGKIIDALTCGRRHEFPAFGTARFALPQSSASKQIMYAQLYGKRGFAGVAIHCKGTVIERCNIENAARCFSHCMQRVGLQGMQGN